jgi:hypothetical protein
MDSNGFVISRNDFPVAIFFGTEEAADLKAKDMQVEHFQTQGQAAFDSKEHHAELVRYHASKVPVVS